MEIERLMDLGYEAKHISKMTNIPTGTVYRVVDKLRKEARFDFKDLMSKDYLYKFQQTMENFSKTIQVCNEEIARIDEKYDVLEFRMLETIEQLQMPRQAVTKANLLLGLLAVQNSRNTEKLKLMIQRDRATEQKAKMYNQGPVVNAIDELFQKYQPENADIPTIGELKMVEEIREEYSPSQRNKEDLNMVQNLNEEDMDALREMEEDDGQ